SYDATIRLWEPASGKPLRRLEVEGLRGGVLSLAFSPDGKILASGGNCAGDPIALWDVARGKRLRSLRRQQGMAYALAFSPDGRILASGEDEYTVRRWDVASGREENPFRGQSPPGRGPERRDTSLSFVGFSPDGRTLVAAADLDRLGRDPLPRDED